MKFLQLNINSFNITCGDLWYHQMENHYAGIFLQETNDNNSRKFKKLESCTRRADPKPWSLATDLDHT